MKTLEQIIEEEVSESVARVLRRTERAVAEAFEARFRRALQDTANVSGSSPRPPSGGEAKKSPPKRRSTAEIVDLSERFLKIVREDPGQPMSVLAPRLGVKPAELAAPVARLRERKQIKSVGRRSLTRYFPVTQDVAA